MAALWVRLDPGLDWLADVRVAQPLKMWTWQLQHVRGGSGVGGSVLTLGDPAPGVDAMSRFGLPPRPAAARCLPRFPHAHATRSGEGACPNRRPADP